MCSNRMQEDEALDAAETQQALGRKAAACGLSSAPRRDTGFHFVDHLAREAKTLAGIEALTAASYVVRSTIHPALQRATETALQDGLARYERNTGRSEFDGAGGEPGGSDPAHRSRAESRREPAWQQALESARLPLYDVHWPPAVVVGSARQAGPRSVRVGLADGRVLPLIGRRAPRRAAQAPRCRLCARHRGQGQEGGARRVARARRRCRARRWCWRTNRPHPRDGRRLLLSAEPAQPRHAGAAPAGLDVQAAHLSGGACARACSPTRWCWTSRSRCRRSAVSSIRARAAGLLDAEELRRRQRPASSRCAARWKIRGTS